MTSPIKKLSTPALLPWIPPGKTQKEGSFNSVVNKKNDGVYDFGSSIAHSTVFEQPERKPVSLSSSLFVPKKNSRKLTLGPDSERKIERLDASHKSEEDREFLKGEIIKIFEEEERKQGEPLVPMEAIVEEEDLAKSRRRLSDPDLPAKDEGKQSGKHEGKQRSKSQHDDKERRSRERDKKRSRSTDKNRSRSKERRHSRPRDKRRSRSKGEGRSRSRDKRRSRSKGEGRSRSRDKRRLRSRDKRRSRSRNKRRSSSKESIDEGYEGHKSDRR